MKIFLALLMPVLAATAAERRATAAEPVDAQKLAEPRQAPRPSGFSGRYYGMAGRTLNTWDFNSDGTFYHTTMVSSAGTSVRNGERGAFEVNGDKMILRVASAVSAYVTPGVGGRTTALGGSSEKSAEVRRLSFKDKGALGIVLGGAALKPKSW